MPTISAPILKATPIICEKVTIRCPVANHYNVKSHNIEAKKGSCELLRSFIHLLG